MSARTRLRVAVAMSGGVDSSVAAWMLAKQGHEVIGMYMRNWDEKDEFGECRADRDWEDVQRVCAQLPCGPGLAAHPPPIEINLVKEYWQSVFSPFLEGYSAGLTPNPDIACNREIKFGAFRERALAYGVDVIATGHYARVARTQTASMLSSKIGDADVHGYGSSNCSHGSGGGQSISELWTARDMQKDQSYFLSHVQAHNLASMIFPLGDLDSKRTVRSLAADAGLVTAMKRESMGICFIGKRRFRDFLGEYIDTTPGQFIALEEWERFRWQGSQCAADQPALSFDSVAGATTLGPHAGFETYTIGQGAKIPGGIGSARGNGRSGHGRSDARWFVCGKDSATGHIVVAQGSNHPSLFTDSLSARLADFSWVAGAPPASLLQPPDASSSSSSSSCSAPSPSPSSISASASAASAAPSAIGGSNNVAAGSPTFLSRDLRCLYRVRHRQELAPCTVRIVSSTAAAAAVSYSATLQQQQQQQCNVAASGSRSSCAGEQTSSARRPGAGGAASEPLLHVTFDEPMRGVAEGQNLALYLPVHDASATGYVCLGGGAIRAAGPSYWHLDKPLPENLNSWVM